MNTVMNYYGWADIEETENKNQWKDFLYGFLRFLSNKAWLFLIIKNVKSLRLSIFTIDYAQGKR